MRRNNIALLVLGLTACTAAEPDIITNGFDETIIDRTVRHAQGFRVVDIDNDGNSLTDCEDLACSDEPECQTVNELSFEGEGGLSIPDNDPVGVGSSINVSDIATIRGLRVEVDISHTYRSDLRVSLHRGSEAIVLHDRTGGGADNLSLEVSLDDWNGSDLEGEYRLVIVDSARIDVGTLNSWRLTAVID